MDYPKSFLFTLRKKQRKLPFERAISFFLGIVKYSHRSRETKKNKTRRRIGIMIGSVHSLVKMNEIKRFNLQGGYEQGWNQGQSVQDSV